MVTSEKHVQASGLPLEPIEELVDGWSPTTKSGLVEVGRVFGILKFGSFGVSKKDGGRTSAGDLAAIGLFINA